jgi:hypothetical protein
MNNHLALSRILLSILFAICSCQKHDNLGSFRTSSIDTMQIDSLVSIYYEDSSFARSLNSIKVNGIRDKKEVIKTTILNSYQIRTIYSKRLKESPKLNGEIILKYQIISNGDIINCMVYKTVLKDSVFVNQIRENVSNWKFPDIHNNNDTTEVLYPFVFKQGF